MFYYPNIVRNHVPQSLCLNARKSLRRKIGASNRSHHSSANSYHAAFDREPALREELDGLRINPVLLDQDARR
jgi:hypothetical protein